MALIGQIRKRSGLLIVIIGVALAAFVLGDFLNPRSGRQSVDVGVIAGENISYQEFSEKSEEQLELMRQRQEKDRLTPEEIFQTRQMTWNQMVNQIIMGKEYEKLGLRLTPDELFDQVQGPDPHTYILQNFRDPNTNMYDPQLVLNFLRNLDQVEPETREQWLLLENAIKEDRINTKYRNLLTKGYYVPTAFAKMEYERRNETATARVVGLRYNVIADDEVTVTDEDFRKYYEENRFRYEQEESRDIDYVIFDVQPSEEDRQKAVDDINKIYNDIFSADNMAEFVNINSDERYDSSFKKRGELPLALDSVVFAAEVGQVFGPYFENGMFEVARLLDRQMRPDSMRASHVLIAYRGAFNAAQDVTRSKEDAEQLADSLRGVLAANPMMFESIARQFSNDPSVEQNGGDLDWFLDQTMVGPFNKAVLESQVGTVTTAETVFGFHVIQVTGKTAPAEKVKVAVVKRRLEPSAATFQDLYTQASQFAGSVTTAVEFDQVVADQGLNKRVASNIKKMDNRIPGIENPRPVIQWAYMDETAKGDVSGVFDLDGSYVVAALKEVREDGIASLEQIRGQIEPLVIREKKAQMLMERIRGAAASDIYQLAAAVEASVDTLNNISFASGNLPGFGPEPELVGKLFTATVGQLSEPVQGNSAAYVFVLDNLSTPPEKEDFSAEAMQMKRSFEGNVGQRYFMVLQDLFKIEDNRHMFF